MKPVTLAFVGIALLATACSSQPSLPQAQYGSARLMVASEEARRVLYLAGDIHSARVTVRTSVNGGAYTTLSTAEFTGAALAGHLSGNTFTFTVDNLRVNDTSTYAYQAQVDVYLDAGYGTLLGSSTSEAFGVTTSPSPTTVTLSNLRLLATPVGSASAGLTIIDTPAAPVVIR